MRSRGIRHPPRLGTPHEIFVEIYLERARGTPFFELDELRTVPVVRELRRLSPRQLMDLLDGVSLFRTRAALEIQLTNIANCLEGAGSLETSEAPLGLSKTSAGPKVRFCTNRLWRSSSSKF